MNITTKTAGMLIILLTAVLTSGCVTGIIGKPDISKLAYDQKGVLRYQGQEVEGIKVKLPWYHEMWPDNVSEWGFTLVTVGITAVASGGVGGGNDNTETPVTVSTPTITSSGGGGSRNDDPVVSTSTSGGGGGSAPPASPAPPSGGGTELPF